MERTPMFDAGDPVDGAQHSRSLAHLNLNLRMLLPDDQTVRSEGEGALAALQWLFNDEFSMPNPPCDTFVDSDPSGEPHGVGYCRTCAYVERSHEWKQHWLTVWHALSAPSGDAGRPKDSSRDGGQVYRDDRVEG